MTDPTDLSTIPKLRVPPTWLRSFQTASRLRPEQLAHLVAKRVLCKLVPARIPRVDFDPALRPGWSPRAAFLDDPCAKSYQPGGRTLRLIQLVKTLPDPVDWVPAGMPLLWQLELNYFHWLPGDTPWSDARSWLADWLERAPRDPRAIVWAPFGAAQRALRWTRLVRGPWSHEIPLDPLYPRLLREMYAHGRFLAWNQEKEFLGNHLIKTAAALHALGRFFGGEEADGWLRQARQILRRETASQVLADGGHYERSPMYHLFVLVDLADAVNITPEGEPFADDLLGPIRAMHRFAAECAHGDGEIPLFNDSVLGQAPRRVDVLEYVERVCGLTPERGCAGFLALPQTGLFRLGDDRVRLWLDAGETGPPFLQAHAHADTGTFELSVGATRLIADTAVYSYQDRDRRAHDRSTVAHNTASVAGENSTDCWGAFRAARRASVRVLDWQADERQQSVRFIHDGFRHLPGSPRHERTVTFLDGVYLIRDRVLPRRAVPLRCDLFLHLGPETAVEFLGDPVTAGNPWSGYSFIIKQKISINQIFITVKIRDTKHGSGIFLEDARLSPRFFDEIRTRRLRVAVTSRTNLIEVITRISSRE